MMGFLIMVVDVINNGVIENHKYPLWTVPFMAELLSGHDSSGRNVAGAIAFL